MADFTRFMTPEQIVAALTEEISKRGEPMRIELHPVAVWHLAGLLVIAVKHPQLTGTMRVTGTGLLADVRDYFADCPTVIALLDREPPPSPPVVGHA